MGLLVNLLFVALWSCLGFFALRLIAVRYFHERWRANVAASGVVLAFAIGTLWPYSSRLRLAPATNAAIVAASTAADATAPAVATPFRDVSARCGTVTGYLSVGGFGALDTLATQNNTLISGGSKLAFGVPYKLYGWAADVSHDRPASGVCLVVDGRVVRSAKSLYGAARPDVVAAFNRGALLPTAYVITIAPGLLARGHHELQVAVLSEHGIYMIVAGHRNVTVQ